MPNAEGRAATRPRKTAAKPASTSTAADGAPVEKAERHVRSPLERAEAAAEKAAATLAKLKERKAEAQAKVDELKPAIDEAQIVADWTASHPLLVAKRRAAGEDVQIVTAVVAADAQPAPAEQVVADTQAGTVEVAPAMTAVDDDELPVPDENDDETPLGDVGGGVTSGPAPIPTPSAEPFSFDTGGLPPGLAAGLAGGKPSAGTPFDFDAQGPQNIRV